MLMHLNTADVSQFSAVIIGAPIVHLRLVEPILCKFCPVSPGHHHMVFLAFQCDRVSRIILHIFCPRSRVRHSCRGPDSV